MVFRLEIKVGFFAENLDDLIVFLFTGKKIFVGKIWKFCHEVENLIVQSVEFFVRRGNFFAEFAHLSKYLVYGLPLFFELGDLSGNFVSHSLVGFDFLQYRLSFRHPLKKFGKVGVTALFGKRLLNEIGAFGYQLYIQHF